MRRELPTDVAVECDVAAPKAEEDGEQQQRVFRRLSECFSFFDKRGPLRSGFGFGRSISFNMDERGYEGDLQLDLSRRSAGVPGKVAI